jgi:Ulp1 family protease
MKKYLILYLDSLQGVPPKSVLNLSLNLYGNASIILEEIPDASTFVVANPKDIPQQPNSYDCGLYCCLFGEVILRRSTEIVQFHEAVNMFSYRRSIKDKILTYMKNLGACNLRKEQKNTTGKRQKTIK